MRNHDRDDAPRDLLLRRLRGSAQPVGVAELSAQLGVHSNTVRFHLSVLEEEGRIERVESVATGRGRPPVLYRAVPGADPGARRYELLADILLESLGAGPEASERAADAGAAWGRRYAERSQGDNSPPERLVEYLDEIGFAPLRTEPLVVELHNCPFLGAVEDRGEVVCAVHAGLMRGVLEGWGTEPSETELEPFVRPGVCRVRLERAGAAA